MKEHDGDFTEPIPLTSMPGLHSLLRFQAVLTFLFPHGDLSEDSVQFGRVLRLQGTIARHQGEFSRAEKLLLESAKIFSMAYEKLESARTAYELGILALIQTNYSEAQQYFVEARTIFDEVGADKELLRLDFAMSQITV